MKIDETDRNRWRAALAACGLLICLTLIPVIHHWIAVTPETVPVIYD